MKFKFILPFLLLLSGLVSAQNKNELEEHLQEKINEIQSLIKLSKLRIELSAGSATDFNPNEDSFFEEKKLATNENLKDKLKEFFNSRKATYSAVVPYALMTYDDDNHELQQLLGKGNTYFMNNWDKRPIFTPTAVEYTDGTSENIINYVITLNKVMDKYTKKIKENGKEEEIVDVTNGSEIEKYLWEESRRNSKQMAVLERTKILKKINYQVQIPLEETKIFYVSKPGETIETSLGKIEFAGISGNEIQFRIPSVMKEQVEVKPLYKDGRTLKFKNSNSHTVFSEEKIGAYQAYAEALEQALKLLKSGKINDKATLEKYMEENTPKALKSSDEKTSYSQVSMTFSGPIDRVAFIIPTSEAKLETFQGSADLAYDEDEKDYIVAQDFKTKNLGILGKNGEWLIKPQFDGYFRMLNRYYFTDQIDNRDNTYHFNLKTKIINKINYKLDDSKIYQDKYVIIETQTNGNKGLAEASTGEMVLPMDYDFLRLKDDKFWHVKTDGKEGVLDNNLKTIMPVSDVPIDIEGGYFFVKKPGYSTRLDAYDAKGKNLTNGKFSEIKGTFNSGLLLVTKEEKTKNGNQTHYYYIDNLCIVKIDVTAKNYDDPEEFSAGLAVVQNKDGDYGYINTAGAVAIPFQYKYARYFFPTSKLALVKLKDDTHVLIDQQGKVVKKLPGDFVQTKLKKESRASRILMADRKSFNEYGEAIEYKSGDYW
jgi:hypothetical protein